MPLLPLSSSDEGFTVEGIAAEEEEGRQSRLGIREGERDDESRLGGEPEDWTSYRSEDCLTYEDCLDNCLEISSQMQLQEKKMRPVPAGKKGKGLRKLPKAVRNKMGFMKKGGRVKKRKK